ncbi:FAD-dependent monooxygenase [Plantactinospora sp. B5E13]|uniref:FAD-dependent monooxygenase n=1 Tax=unclassified Plantactinospora TaxID=2631981 RepID=UPI00325F3CA3
MGQRDPRIAVVGAGIAGLTVAAGLTRLGLASTVFEQAPQLGEVGAGLQLAPNAVRLLRRLGLGRELDRVAVRPEAIEMRRWQDGELIMVTELGDACEQRYGAPYYTVHRADLHRCLRALLPDDPVRLGRRCRSVSERPDGVELGFDTGEGHRADLVVGADGIHSVVRAALLPDRPRFSGETIYRGLVRADRLPSLAERPRVRLWLGPGRHVVCYPVSGGDWISFGATVPADDWQVESWSAEADPGELRKAYQGWHPDVVNLLAEADPVRRWALHDRDAVDRWSTDRLTLVGDAAHPMLPFFAQGANQAVEDAFALAACLARTDGGVAGALRRYEEVRAPRVAQVHQRSRGNATALHLPDGVAQRDRDAALRHRADLSHQDWLYGHDAELVGTG